MKTIQEKKKNSTQKQENKKTRKQENKKNANLRQIEL